MNIFLYEKERERVYAGYGERPSVSIRGSERKRE
jgi:hypothetical protein